MSDFDLVGGKATTGGTRTGAMGSFVYAAPEMLSRPQNADVRTDVFGLGMTALFCLHGSELPNIVFRRPERVLAELRRPRMEAVLARAIEWEPADRFEDVRSFCDAFQAAAGREDAPGKASIIQEKPQPQARPKDLQDWRATMSLREFLNNRRIEAGPLTDRQLEVAWLLGTTDLSYRQIADQLGIALGTARTHVQNVYRAFGVRSRPGLAVKLR